MKLYSSKSDIWYYLVVYMEIMAVCLFGDILPSDSQAMIWCRSIFGQVHNSPSFYAFNFILLLTGAVYMLNKQMHRKVFRISKCVSYVTSILLVVVCSSKHPMAIEYLALAFSFLTCLLIFELNKLFVGAKESDIPNAGVEGFVADCSKQEDLQNVGWDKYAESLLTRLEGTNAVDGAFTVSLTGSWGTGKTTFLSYLKDHMHKNGLVYMDFNPWLSNSTETIIQDFFQALNSKLCEQGIELEDEIDEYVKLLFKWGNESLADKVSEVFPLGDGKDLSVLREELSSGLNLLDGKLYILIDDIDRLQGKEIFEVLKLIRNTADFNHIVYIVTCDKEYVLQSLQDQIKKPDEYLKKIFQLELKFPQYERYLLTHLFKTELYAHTHYDAGLQNQLNNLEMELGRDKIYLRDYLSNFRDAKRLVNVFMLNLDYIAKQGVVADFNIKELFLILLFEYTDEVGFKEFRENLWDIVNKKPSDPKYLELADKNRLATYKFSGNSLRLLNALFPPLSWNTPKPKRNSIRREDKLLTYFSFRPYTYQMSLTDFTNLLKSSSPETIKSYVKNSNVGVFSKASSIYQMLDEQWLNGLDDNTIKNFFLLLTEWTEKYKSYTLDEVGSLYKDILLKSHIDENKVDLIKGILHEYFASIQEPLRGIYILQKILCKMIPCFAQQDGDGNEIFYPECIYSSEELHVMLSENARKFLNMVKPGIKDFLEESRLKSFVGCSVVYNESSSRPQFDSFPIENELITYFSQNKEHHDVRPFIEKFVIANYPGDNDEERIEAMTADIRKYFASIDFYRRFLQECFVHKDGDNTLDEYLKHNRLKAQN